MTTSNPTISAMYSTIRCGNTHLLTLLCTSFWFASVRVDDRDTSNFIRHVEVTPDSDNTAYRGRKIGERRKNEAGEGDDEQEMVVDPKFTTVIEDRARIPATWRPSSKCYGWLATRFTLVWLFSPSSQICRFCQNRSSRLHAQPQSLS